MHQAWKPPEPRTPPASNRVTTLALLIAALGCLILAAARIAHAISLATPLQLVTSGAEEEALAGIWRLNHGQPLYTDPHLIPFTASYFNWLFYALYGLVGKSMLSALHLGDAWLPTICRLLTLTLALAGVTLLVRLLHGESFGRLSWPLAGSLAALAFFNPLCGFWIVTARPDIGMSVLELAGVACALRYVRIARRRWLAATAVCFAAAWAFKQTSLGACAGVTLAFVIRPAGARRPTIDDYRSAGVVVAVVAGSALAACALLGPVYRHGLYGSQVNSGFQLTWGLLHLGYAVAKMPFIAVALAGAARTWRQAAPDPAWRTLSLVLGADFLVELAASCKGGSGDYYFIPLGVGSVLWLGFAWNRTRRPWLAGAVALAALVQIGAVATVLIGGRGTIDPRDPARPYEHLAAFLATRPGPVFVRDTYGDLPWISPTAPHFVIGYNDEVDRLAGIGLEDGGWEGLTARGYFTTVVVTARRHDIPETLLVRYRQAREEAGWIYFERR